jgi:hypothetical protein
MSIHRPRVQLALQTLIVLSLSAIGAAIPVTPTLLGPANGATVDVPFRISWSATLNAGEINAGYNWQVSRSSTFSSLVLMDSTSPATTEDIVSGLTPGTYFWRVQAVDSAGQSSWSPPQSFIVRGSVPGGAPGTPVLSPTQGYSTFHPWELIRFHWSAVPDAVTYRLEVSNDPNFPVGPLPAGTITFWNDNIPTNSDAYVHTMVGNWFARVFAVSANNPTDGIRSLPSNVIQFSCFFNNPIGPPPALISPVDNPTVTLPVTLSWAHVPNPQAAGYLLEVARDPGFADIEFFYNQYTDPTAVMLSLTSGPKFWRVLSQQGLSSPTTNANTDWSATGRFTISSAPAVPVSIAPLGNSEMLVYSGASGMMAVQLTAGVPAGGATIALSSSHPSVVPVPATISMQGTLAWTQFPFTAGQVTTPTVVTLTATLNGASASSQITVRPPTLNDDILQAVVRATGGTPMSGWVDLEGGGLAGPSGFNVALSSSSPAATVPASVIIPAGVSGTSFPIQTSAVTSTTPVTITAAAGGVTSRWTITLTAEPAPTDLLVRPMSTTSGSQGVVRTAEGVGHDQLVHVASSNPSLAAVPESVTVAAVSGIGFFNISTAPVTAPTTVTISVSGGGVTLSHPLTLYPSLPGLTSMTVNPTNVVGGASATGTVRIASPAPPVGVAINLASNLPLTASVPASVTIPNGATSADFTIATRPSDTTTVQLSAALDNVFQFSSITVSNSAPPPPPPPPPSTPSAPSLVAPANGATVTPPILLDWNSVANASSYEVQVDDTSTIAAPFVANPTVTASEVSLTSLPAQQLWWRVRARNASGVFGPFSATRSFTPQTSPPPPSGIATLTVTATGRSGQRITSTPAGINVTVGSTGSAAFNSGTSITLSVTNGRDAIWSGACSSGGNKSKTCTFTITGNSSVTGNVQ